MLTHRRGLLLLLVGPACLSQGVDDRLVRGLDVSLERLSGDTNINGVQLRIERATGPAVSELADRIVKAWQLESGAAAVRLQQQSGWSVASRIHRNESQVVQWRGKGDQAELIWSASDLRRPTSMPRMLLPLPMQCRWTAPVHGDLEGMHFVQSTGTCPGTATAMLTAVANSASGKGWRVLGLTSTVLQAQRASAHAQIMAMPTPEGLSSERQGTITLVAVETRPSARPR